MASADLDDDDGITSINITPMVDIVLVLLVIFMVTTTTINKLEGLEIDKPDAATGQSVDDIPATLHVVCKADGSIHVDGQPAANDAAIIRAIEERRREDEKTVGVISCDEAAQVGVMVHLIDLLRENGIKKYAIATEKPAPADGGSAPE